MDFGNKVLFLSPHSDDEISSGGTIARLVEEGKQVYYAVFSFCEESIPSGFPADILKTETAGSLKALGITEKALTYNIGVRTFPERRQEILEILVSLQREIEPDLVFLPSLYDWHQDHQTITKEGMRAFRFCSILGYETALKTIPLEHSCFIKIEERHLEKKIEASKCYKSQEFRGAWEGLISSLARIRGRQSRVEFAEAFEVIQLRIVK